MATPNKQQKALLKELEGKGVVKLQEEYYKYDLQDFCEILDVAKGGTKEELAKRIVYAKRKFITSPSSRSPKKEIQEYEQPKNKPSSVSYQFWKDEESYAPSTSPASKKTTDWQTQYEKPISLWDMQDSLASIENSMQPKKEFELIEVSRYSAEFQRLQDEFRADLQGHNNDYVSHRLKEGLSPIQFKLVSAKRVHNQKLAKEFENYRATIVKEVSGMSETEKERSTRIRRGYHGSRPKNLELISRNGLLRVGHPKNPSKATDDGYFGDPRFGVYLAKYAEYTLKYSNDGICLEPGDRVKILRFQLCIGKTRHIKQLSVGIKPTPGYHSHSSQNWLEWFLFDERQICPDYILEIEAFENTRTLSDDGTDH